MILKYWYILQQSWKAINSWYQFCTINLYWGGFGEGRWGVDLSPSVTGRLYPNFIWNGQKFPSMEIIFNREKDSRRSYHWLCGFLHKRWFLKWFIILWHYIVENCLFICFNDKWLRFSKFVAILLVFFENWSKPICFWPREEFSQVILVTLLLSWQVLIFAVI